MSQAPARLEDLRIERGPVSAPPGRKLLWGVVIIFLLLAAAATAWWLTRSRTILVRTAVAREATVAGTERTVLNASGYVVARREATVSSKVTGKVAEVAIEEGVSVKEGQLLARLDDTNVQASLLLARAQLNAAETALEETRVRVTEADRELNRQSTLKRNKVAAEAEFDRAEASALAWRARLAQQQSERTVAERTVAVWQQQLEDTLIRAPFAGIVTSKNAQPGEMISPMSSGGFTRTGICTIVDMQSLEIEVDVNESYINRVTPRQPVEATLDAYPAWKIPCRVIAIIPTADRQKSTVKVRVGFDQLDPRILPQMAVKVAFRDAEAPIGSSSAAAPREVRIPKNAVRHQDGRDIVFVINKGRAERRAVTVSLAQGEEALLSAGLATGEKVALDPPATLTDGASVTEQKP